MLADNIVYLKKYYPEIYKRQQELEAENSRSLIIQEDAKNKIKTLKAVTSDQTIYIHSKYDPFKEAELLIEKVTETEEINENSHIIFYGIGLGHHIDVFTSRFPDTAFTLYEPSCEIFSCFLEYKNLKKLSTKNINTIICEYDIGVMNDFFAKIVENLDKKTIIIELPVYRKVFPDQYDQFMKYMKVFIQNKRSSINVDYAYKKRWIVNSVNNFKEVLKTPNILKNNNEIFEGKIAILVSAGPSLDYEIENLKQIKNMGTAFVFSVGSAINTLIHHGIYPDAMCTYDPSEKSQIVFEKVNEMEITSIPMVFGSSVGYEVLEQFKGPKLHMITNQDSVSNYLLKTSDDDALAIVNDAPSIAVVTLELLNKLRFSQIILVGQNLAFQENRQYAGGIGYHQNGMENGVGRSGNKEIITIDVNGNEIETTDSFNRMRNQMETYIKNCNMAVINTTINGAHIDGTQFIPLETLIKELLLEKVVIGNEFEKSKNYQKYDNKYLKEKTEQLQFEFESYQTLLTDIKKQLGKLGEAIKKNNTKLVSEVHMKMDSLIQKMEANDFFKVIAMPLNRVEYGLLVNNAQRAKNEKNKIIRAKDIMKPTETFINLLYFDGNLNQQIMITLNNAVNEYINGSEIKL